MLDQFRHFLLIVKHGSFTEAARHAHVTQPALSTSIRRLEEQLGGVLLHREPRGARPNAAGMALVPKAELALAAAADGRRAVAEVLGLQRGEVRLGAGPTAATYLLPPTLARYRALYPGVRIFLRESHSPQNWEALRRGDIDLGFVTSGSGPSAGTPSDGDWFVAEPCMNDTLVVAAAPGDPSPNSWITFPKGSTLRGLLDDAFDEPDVVMELGSIAAVKGNVRQGIGRCLISQRAIERDVAEGVMIVADDPRVPIHRSLVLVHRGAERLPPAAAKLRELLLAADRAC